VNALPDQSVSTRAGDAELLRGVAAGDLCALGEIYDRYSRDVWRAVRRALGDSADVEDVVHQMFLKLPQIAPSYDGRDSCRGWLCGIAVNLAMRHRRGAGRFQRMLSSFTHTFTNRSPLDPERLAGGQEEVAALERALATLSDKKRAVLLLIEVEGLTAAEAGHALKIPAATVRTRLFHARRELFEVLERGGGDR
jgi:RNA polymerase sigma-70 factor (ECF subfamily)